MSADIKMVRWPDRDRDDFQRLTSALARVREAVRRGESDFVSPALPYGPEEPSDVDRARALLGQHAARARAAGSDADLFVNPAWHTMLTLFVAGEDRRDMSMKAVEAATGALPLAATRWLALLERRGLIDFSGESDVVTLTSAGRAFVIRCLHAI